MKSIKYHLVFTITKFRVYKPALYVGSSAFGGLGFKSAHDRPHDMHMVGCRHPVVRSKVTTGKSKEAKIRFNMQRSITGFFTSKR